MCRRLVAPAGALAVAAAAVLAGCGGSRPAAGSPMYPLGEQPLPAASEHCFRERFEAYGRSFELRLRLQFTPEDGRIVAHADESSEHGEARRTTVMTVDGNRFTSIERGPDGEVRGEGTLRGPEWEWSGWTSVTHRASADEHALATFVAGGLQVDSELRARDGSVLSSGHRRYVTAVCATLGAEPIETLYPPGTPPPTAP